MCCSELSKNETNNPANPKIQTLSLAPLSIKPLMLSLFLHSPCCLPITNQVHNISIWTSVFFYHSTEHNIKQFSEIIQKAKLGQKCMQYHARMGRRNCHSSSAQQTAWQIALTHTEGKFSRLPVELNLVIGRLVPWECAIVHHCLCSNVN